MTKQKKKQVPLKCGICQSEIIECDTCHSDFEKEDFILCDNADSHFCDKECFMEYYSDLVQEGAVE